MSSMNFFLVVLLLAPKLLLGAIHSPHIFLFPSKQDRLLPAYDKNCDAVKISPAPYFSCCDPVPKRIHQIWFGPPKPENKFWGYYAHVNGYEYRLWTEDEDFSEVASKDHAELIRFFIRIKNYCSASDVLRYEVIRKYGGIYVDCDFPVPHKDLQDIIPMQGVTLMVESHARNVGNGIGIFVANGFIAAPAEHPLLNHVSKEIVRVVKEWHRVNKNYNSMYCTGPFLLNKALSGCFNVLPLKYIHEW